jgi:hypothetical protein
LSSTLYAFNSTAISEEGDNEQERKTRKTYTCPRAHPCTINSVDVWV